MQTDISVTKSTGETEKYSQEKLSRSLLRAGTPSKKVDEIISHIESDLQEGMPTDEIYRHAFQLLSATHRSVAARYSLKRALMGFGPSGFPFEQYIARILTAYGYHTQVGVQVSGECVSHEVDVVADKDNERIFVEAKFHNGPETKSDVKTALYIHARFLDIAKHMEGSPDRNIKQYPWLVTNTNFTSQAIQYATCVNLHLIGWNHPKDFTLQDMITETGMHPMPLMTTLTDHQKSVLVEAGHVLCKDIINNPEILSVLHISKQNTDDVVSEAKEICESDAVGTELTLRNLRTTSH